MKIKFFLLTIIIIFGFAACGENRKPEQDEYTASIEAHRTEYNAYMKDNPMSPFNKKGKISFHPLNYFDVDPQYKFESKLYELQEKDTITIYGTKGDERETVRWGYVVWIYNSNKHKISVYEGSSTSSGETYYSIWFTDKTTNNESYGVGRYLNFDKVDDPDHIYTIDFNLAYNPYCAYSKDYSCAIPTKEDYIDAAIEAGEKKFHD